ncbi:MAG: hypothetical protein JEZ00_13760 [Anaerolineaceae bacterium]|nr:hypothetical protein [Anaerolineaceae bacterium]
MTNSQYYINRALISLTVGALLAYFTRNLLLGLGFAVMLFALYYAYARSKFYKPADPAASTPAQRTHKQEMRGKATIWGLSVAIVVFVLLFIVQTRYILPFQPAGFALIAGVLAGVLVYYLQTRKKK